MYIYRNYTITIIYLIVIGLDGHIMLLLIVIRNIFKCELIDLNFGFNFEIDTYRVKYLL